MKSFHEQMGHFAARDHQARPLLAGRFGSGCSVAPVVGRSLFCWPRAGCGAAWGGAACRGLVRRRDATLRHANAPCLGHRPRRTMHLLDSPHAGPGTASLASRASAPLWQPTSAFPQPLAAGAARKPTRTPGRAPHQTSPTGVNGHRASIRPHICAWSIPDSDSGSHGLDVHGVRPRKFSVWTGGCPLRFQRRFAQSAFIKVHLQGGRLADGGRPAGDSQLRCSAR
jgi:hypothetical protein